MSTIGWKIPPTKFGEVTKQDHRKIVSKVGMEVTSRLVQATPVDTGRARANWWPSVTVARTRTLKSTDQSRPMRLASRAFADQKLPYFATLFIANNLDYISKLNSGSSTQAPAHFVESTVGSVLDVL